MPKQKVTIELNVPEGFEATGEHRPPRKNEWVIMAAGSEPYKAGWDSYTPCFILRKLPQFPPYPEFLGGAGMAMDGDGRWFLYEKKPFAHKMHWDGCVALPIPPIFFPTIQFPDTSTIEWDKSWWPNPRYKEEGNG